MGVGWVSGAGWGAAREGGEASLSGRESAKGGHTGAAGGLGVAAVGRRARGERQREAGAAGKLQREPSAAPPPRPVLLSGIPRHHPHLQVVSCLGFILMSGKRCGFSPYSVSDLGSHFTCVCHPHHYFPLMDMWIASALFCFTARVQQEARRTSWTLLDRMPLQRKRRR